MQNDEECWRMNAEWWRMLKDEWRMNEEWWRMMISSCWGVLVTDRITDICECRVAFATEKGDSYKKEILSYICCFLPQKKPKLNSQNPVFIRITLEIWLYQLQFRVYVICGVELEVFLILFSQTLTLSYCFWYIFWTIASSWFAMIRHI